MKNNKISIINVNKESIDDSKEEELAKREITNFCDNFQNEIKQNFFVKNTISPIVCYLIRRYFYPTEYFKDASFFDFDNQML